MIWLVIRQNTAEAFDALFCTELVSWIVCVCCVLFIVLWWNICMRNSFGCIPVISLQGYSMDHTLNKWSHLGFASHWVAAATYIFYLLIWDELTNTAELLYCFFFKFCCLSYIFLSQISYLKTLCFKFLLFVGYVLRFVELYFKRLVLRNDIILEDLFGRVVSTARLLLPLFCASFQFLNVR